MKSTKRAAGVVIKGDKILLIHRFYEGKEYFVFPGGGVEEGETEEEAVIRELKEELSIDAKIERILFKVFNPNYTPDNKDYLGRDDYFFLVTEFLGEPMLGGPEKKRMNENDQYYLEWHKISELKNLNNLYAEHEKTKVIEALKLL